MNISEEEKENIKEKWLTYSIDTLGGTKRENSQVTILIASIIGLFAIGIVFLIVHRVHLRREKHFIERKRTGAEELRKQLQEIEDANNLVSKEIQEIKEFGERLEKKGE
jgi:hypothetical protein